MCGQNCPDIARIPNAIPHAYTVEMERQRTPRPENQAIVDDLRAGMSTGEVATRDNISPTRVARFRSYHRIPSPSACLDEDAILADLRHGLSLNAICEAHHTSYRRVRGIACKHGLDRSRTALHPEDAPLLADLRAGMSVTDVAHKHCQDLPSVVGLALRHKLIRPKGRQQDAS
jgi:hypothetical protein